MIVKLLTEHHLEFLSLKGGCRGSSESTLVKMSHCWKSHATAQISCNMAVVPTKAKFGYCLSISLIRMSFFVSLRACLKENFADPIT